jgi:carbon storage regulator
MVGGNIEITIVNVRGNKVRLGITAPKDISVHRKEVYEAIQHGETVKNHQCKENVERTLQ